MNTLNIFIDGKGLQAQFQVEYQTRLASLFESFDLAGFQYSISNINDSITASALEGFNILMITSRYERGQGSQPDPSFYYTDAELAAILDFVQAGNGLLLMSNHSTGGGNDNNITMYDQALANQFGVTLEQAFWIQPGESTTMSGDLLLDSSPIISSGGGVSSIVINDGCSLTSSMGATVVVQLNSAMSDIHVPSMSSDGQAFALSMEGQSIVGSGRAIFTADSGFLGTCVDPNPKPGPGQFCYGDNPTFVVNCINWLGGNC